MTLCICDNWSYSDDISTDSQITPNQIPSQWIDGSRSGRNLEQNKSPNQITVFEFWIFVSGRAEDMESRNVIPAFVNSSFGIPNSDRAVFLNSS